METLTPLFRPRTYYDRFPSTILESFVVVMLVGSIVTGSLLSVGWLATGTMTTNIAVESPVHPSDALCEQSGDGVQSVHITGCSVPQTSAQRATDWRYVGGWAPVTFAGIFAVWTVLALGIHGLSRLLQVGGDLINSFAIAGWATAPLAIEAIVTLSLVFLAFARIPPGTVLDAARELVIANGGLIRFLVSGGTAIWQAYIIGLSLVSIREVRLPTALLIGASTSLVLFVLAGI